MKAPVLPAQIPDEFAGKPDGTHTIFLGSLFFYWGGIWTVAVLPPLNSKALTERLWKGVVR